MAAPHILALHLTRPSGSEAKVLASLLRHKDRDIRVSLVVNARGVDDEHSHFREFDEDETVNVIPCAVGLPVDHWKPDSAVLRLLHRGMHVPRRLSILRLARQLRPDLIYTSQQRFDCRIGTILSKRMRLPHVVHLHYLPDESLRRPALERLRTCDRVIAISQYVADLAQAERVDPGRITVIHNTVDQSPPQNAGQPARESTVLTIGQFGRMHPGKGFPDTVRAFAHLHDVDANARLVLLGEGSEQAETAALVSELELDDVVQMLGWQPDVDPFLRGIDIFVHPSRREPFGLAVVEAMAAGLPVVAWGEGGVCETVRHEVTGLLLTPGDDAGLAQALVRLAENPEERKAFGEAGRDRVAQHFAPPDAGRAFSEMVHKVLAEVSEI